MVEPVLAQASNLKAKSQRPENSGHERLSDVAYRKILKGLFDRTVPAGGFVSQNSLVDLLGVPIQPLRDALRILEAEGVLTIHPRSGIQFLKPDLELARSTYQFRTIIERWAARSFAESCSAEAVAEMIAAHEKLITDIEAGSFDEEILARLDELENVFHGSMVASLRNPLIETTAERLKNYVRLIKLERLMTQPLALRTLREHLEVLHAAERRDADAAEAALANHLQTALQRILGML